MASLWGRGGQGAEGGAQKAMVPWCFFFQDGWGVKWKIVTIMKQTNWRVVSSFKQDIFRIFEEESWFASCIFTRKLRKILYFTFNVLHRVKPFHSVGLIFLWVFLGDKATSLGHIVKGSTYTNLYTVYFCVSVFCSDNFCI